MNLPSVIPWGRLVPSWLRRTVGGSDVVEGQYRPGPYFLSTGWLPHGTPWNFWQSAQDVRPYSQASAMVEACVGAYSQTIAMLPADHWRNTGDGGRERVTTSAASRVLKRPNDYLSSSDFFLNLTRRLYQTGNAYAVAVRNDRREIAELHLMERGRPVIATTGDIFYQLSGNEVMEERYDFSAPIPARDVLHVRLHTPTHPLIGVSPILAALLDLAMSGTALSQQIKFYLEGARPSFIIYSPENLNEQTVEELRQRWLRQTTGGNVAGSPILTRGLKAEAVDRVGSDPALADLLKMANENVALAFRMPLAILGLGGAAFASTELLMGQWVSTSLGFAANHIEVALDNLFGLRGPPEEYIQLDTRVLLRSAFKDQIEGLRLGVQGGIYSPDEARAMVELPKVPGGHGAMPRVQQQVVPLSYGTDLQPPSPSAPTPAPAKPAPDDPPDPANDDETGDDADRASAAFELEYERLGRAHSD